MWCPTLSSRTSVLENLFISQNVLFFKSAVRYNRSVVVIVDYRVRYRNCETEVYRWFS